MIELSGLYCYRLKSGNAEELLSSSIELRGLPYDRHWMVVSEQGELISQRQKGMQKLALISANLIDDELVLSAPGMNIFTIPMSTSDKLRVEVEVHGQCYPAIDEGEKAAQWISTYLPKFKGSGLRIVHFPSDYLRDLRGIYTDADTAQTEFADGFPLLICSEASLDKLNSTLATRGQSHVAMDRFRTNLVLRGCDAFEEDTFKTLQIGGERGPIIEIVKPCARCPVTGVDQELGAFSQNPREPRSTLEEIHAGRHLKALFPHLEDSLLNKSMFGENAVVLRPGVAEKGSIVRVLSTRTAQ